MAHDKLAQREGTPNVQEASGARASGLATRVALLPDTPDASLLSLACTRCTA